MAIAMAGNKARVFLDSNVILSGMFSDRGAPRLVLDVLSLGLPALAAVTGAYNIAEVERNLKAKLPDGLQTFRDALKDMNVEIVPWPSKKDLAPLAGLTAQKDLPAIASAIKGRSDILVTGDMKHLLRVKKGRLPFPIASPAEFLDELLPELLKRD